MPAPRAVILAGGQGTRLRPLTLARAKPVVPLLNRPFLAYQVALLAHHGISDIVLSCSYRVDDVRLALGDAEALGVKLTYVVEAEPLGTGGGVRYALDQAGPGDGGAVLVLNGDILTDADLAAMRAFHDTTRSRTTIFLTRVPDPRPYGLVETDADSRLRRFREKPAAEEELTTNTINAGVYIIDADLVRRLPADRPASIEREFFPALIADGVPCFGWAEPAYWRDIGSPAAYHLAQVDLLDGRVRSPLSPPGAPRDGSWVADGARATGARLEPPSVLGPRVLVESGAHVGPHAVIGEASRIGPRARIANAILWERVHVGAGSVLRDCVVAADVRIGAHAEVGAGVILESGAVVPDHTRLSRP